MVEVGTWNGKRAVRLARVALRQVPRFHYRGYDLFESASRETDERELNVKHHASRDAVRERLEAFRAAHPGFSFELFAGDTRETLADQRADFAYIDGGHSVDTIRGDYERLRACPVVVFDDYYEPDGQAPARICATTAATQWCGSFRIGCSRSAIPSRGRAHAAGAGGPAAPPGRAAAAGGAALAGSRAGLAPAPPSAWPAGGGWRLRVPGWHRAGGLAAGDARKRCSPASAPSLPGLRSEGIRRPVAPCASHGARAAPRVAGAWALS